MIIGQKNYDQFPKFIFVGVLNTGLGYFLFALFLKLGLFYLLSLTVSHILATIHSYIWNRYFTFKSKTKIISEIPKFFLIYAFVYAVNFLLLYIAVDVFKLKPLFAQIPILLIVITISFTGQKFFTFRKLNQTAK